jgi:hypothetical protein
MLPHGRTHNFPQGKPLSIRLLEVALAIVGILWLFLASRSWINVSLIGSVFLALMVLYSRRLSFYEKTGEALPIPQRRTLVKFRSPVPASIVVLRCGFLVAVAAMIVFGFAPFSERIVRTGIVVCVLALFAIAFIHVALEQYYVNRGRAEEIEVRRSDTPQSAGMNNPPTST